MFGDDLGYGARADQVVQHGRSGVLAQDRRSQQRSGGRPAQPVTSFVDDEDPIRELICFALDGRGHQVSDVASGLDANELHLIGGTCLVPNKAEFVA